MLTVSDLVGAYKGTGKALVIYLPTAPDRATTSGQTFERLLGNLGRDLHTMGTVVMAFDGYDDKIASQVLAKPWSEKERLAIEKRPGLLIIDQNFADFDPRAHNFFHLDVSNLYNANGTLNERLAVSLVFHFQKIFASGDLFRLLEEKRILMRRQIALASLKAEPTFCGFGVNLVRLLDLFKL